jgi:hypothetical protein
MLLVLEYCRTVARNVPIFLHFNNQLVAIFLIFINCPHPHTLCSVLSQTTTLREALLKRKKLKGKMYEYIDL